MSTQQAPDQNGSRPETNPLSFYHEHHHGFGAESYTSQKLRYGSAHHLHVTSRRFFIGPIPAGWLQSHRKSWYKKRLKFRNYTSHAVTFSADPIATYYRQNSDRLGPSPPAPQQYSSPTDATEGEDTGTEQENVLYNEETEQSSEPLRTIPEQAVETGEDSQSPAPGAAGSSDPTWKKPKDRQNNNTQDTSSYFTAREDTADGTDSQGRGRPQGHQERNANKQRASTLSRSHSNNQMDSMTSSSDADSARGLLRSKSKSKAKIDSSATSLAQQEPRSEESGEEEDLHNGSRTEHNLLSPLVSKITRLSMDDNLLDKRKRFMARVSRARDSVSSNRHRHSKSHEGEIVKAENMLVRVEETLQNRLPDDYTENDSLRMEARVVDKWREYLVVCRRISEENTSFSLQMYRTHVIPEVHKPGSTKQPHYEVLLNHKDAKVNLYSSLDKTLVIWHPCRHGTRIYIVRARSAAHSVEWYTFLRQALGWLRPSSLKIYVPDLDVSLIFKNPLEQWRTNSRSNSDRRQSDDVLGRSSSQERFAATSIIRGCLEMLENRSEWADILKAWLETEKVGLAWKRYDRLEWVYGVNEEKMFGAIAMQTSHDLELRPRHHYPTVIKPKGDKQEEPAPVEGFLIRLTSQQGVHQRMNKMFFKRLYFFTQDHFLLFCRPPKAFPPQPPKFHTRSDSDVPSPEEILNEMPLSYDVDPFPVQNGEIAWLSSGNEEYVKRHDEEAYAEMQRNIHNLSEADGYIDLCRVQEVRVVQRGSSPADSNVRQGPDVEFHPQSRDTHRDDGATGQFDDERTFELSLENGLVVRLQAYNSATREEWIKRLDALVKYWKARTAADVAEIKSVKQRNLKLLDIDEEMESILGQFASKWEVKKAEASPYLHNMCTLSGCRTIKISGQLYHKPRRRSTFRRCHVILTAERLLIFRSSLRKRTGVEIPHIHQELEMALDLRDCYIYSGLLTESDVLYTNQTFDSNHPGHRALPRIYLSSDVYTSRDEDTAISFVIWQPLQKNYFRAKEVGEQGEAKQTVRHVTTLGVHGRTVMFKARSRVEKDRWVLSIAAEIDRLQEDRQEDMRIVSPQ